MEPNYSFFLQFLDFLVKPLLVFLEDRVSKDFIWSQIAVRIFTGIPDRSMESVFVALFHHVKW